MKKLIVVFTKEFWKKIPGRMKRFIINKKTWKWAGIIAAALVMLLFIIRAWIDYSAQSMLDAEIEKIRESGAPLTWNDLEPPEIPAKENAATFYMKAFKLISKATNKKARELYENHEYILTESDQKEYLPELRKLLEKNKDVISLIKQGVSKKECYFKLVWKFGMPDKQNNDYLSQFFDCCTLLLLESEEKYYKGKVDEALESCVTLLRFGNHISKDANIFGYAASQVPIAMSYENIQKFLQRGNASLKICERVIRAMQKTNHLSSLKKALEFERAKNIEDLMKAINNDEERTETESTFRKVIGWAWKPMLKKDVALYIKTMNEVISLVEEPFLEAKVQLLKTYNMIEDLPSYYFFTKVSGLNNYYSLQMATDEKARLEIVMLGVALKYFKQKNGQYPSSLAELKDEILTEIPVDPFTGNEYIYVKEIDTVYVYSVGIDMKDGGGMKEGRRAFDDHVWHSEKGFNPKNK